LDLAAVLGHCQRTAENEMELFSIRKAAAEQLKAQVDSCIDEIKKRNRQTWLDSLMKLWPGVDNAVDLSREPMQPRHIDLIP
jgi:hypothetical protein